MKIFNALFAICAAAALLGMVAIYGASLRKSLMGDYDKIMATARGAASDFSPIGNE